MKSKDLLDLKYNKEKRWIYEYDKAQRIMGTISWFIIALFVFGLFKLIGIPFTTIIGVVGFIGFMIMNTIFWYFIYKTLGKWPK